MEKHLAIFFLLFFSISILMETKNYESKIISIKLIIKKLKNLICYFLKYFLKYIFKYI